MEILSLHSGCGAEVDCDSAPAYRACRTVCQPGIHGAHRRLDGRGVKHPAELSLWGGVAARAYLPLSVASRQRGILGQPGDLPLCVERLSKRTAVDASRHIGRRGVDRLPYGLLRPAIERRKMAATFTQKTLYKYERRSQHGWICNFE